MQTKNIQYEFHINEFQITLNTAYSQQFTSNNSHNKQLLREGVAKAAEKTRLFLFRATDKPLSDFSRSIS
jgi:hypothetical protein